MIDKPTKLRNIKILLFDLGGVVVLSSDSDSDEIIKINQMLHLLKLAADKINIKLGIISSFNKFYVEQFRESGITDLYSSSLDKVSVARQVLEFYGYDFQEIAYIGNDLLDIPLLAKCGFSAAPASARREVKRAVDYVGKSSSKSILIQVIELIGKYKHSNV